MARKDTTRLIAVAVAVAGMLGLALANSALGGEPRHPLPDAGEVVAAIDGDWRTEVKPHQAIRTELSVDAVQYLDSALAVATGLAPNALGEDRMVVVVFEVDPDTGGWRVSSEYDVPAVNKPMQIVLPLMEGRTYVAFASSASETTISGTDQRGKVYSAVGVGRTGIVEVPLGLRLSSVFQG